MSDTLRIALAQLNPHEGDVRHNLAGIRRARAEGARLGADLVVTPEFSIGGYPPEDLVRKPAFVAACEAAIAELAADTADGGPGLIVGGPWREGERIFNAAFVLDGGRIIARRAKHELPNYGVFDDKRVFDAGPAPGPVAFRGFRLGLMICEDWWFPAVSETLAESGAELLLSINGSPYETDKQAHRQQLAIRRVVETGLAFVFCAQVCGQDELVFEGASFVLNPDRSLAVQMPYFEESVTLTEWRREGERMVCAPQPLPEEPDRLALIYRSLMLGPCRLRAQEPVPRHHPRAFGRHRQRALGGDRGRRAGAGEGARLHAAEPVHQPREPGGRRGRRPPARHKLRHGADHRSDGRLLRGAGADLRRPAGGHHRGEHPVARARPDPHGDLQQVRPHAADHRQQERDVGRLCDALRRHVRRVIRC